MNKVHKCKAAIIGSGNIGIDLMMKTLRDAQYIELSALVGIDPDSEGLKKAKEMGLAITHEGVEGLIALPEFNEIDFVFDASSANAHLENETALRSSNKDIRLIDLTPAAIGPYCVPVANLDEHLRALNVNMVTCGGQATIPIVRAVSQVATVHYAEIIASIASRSAGVGTRANIDEFTETTSRAIENIGKARKAKSIIILNPAEPPLAMRNTVYTLSDLASEQAIIDSINQTVSQIRQYVPGYRLKQEVQFERFTRESPLYIPDMGSFEGLKTSVYLEITGAGQYLPTYAGNLDIMTSAALATAERMAQELSD